LARVPITVLGYRCGRCGHEWVPRDVEKPPKGCPKCRSPHWDVPENQEPTTYERFRDAIKKTIVLAGKPLTWTEIRTRAGLPQLYPNNKWVSRLETDIGLLRARDQQGIILWTIAQLEKPHEGHRPT
jgi:predicted  nucleic acid-binding Zn-ribbon protein